MAGAGRAAMAAAADLAAAAAASTTWSPSKWEALSPPACSMADILRRWPGAAALGLMHGDAIGQGSQGAVSRLLWARTGLPAGLPAAWPVLDGGAPVPGVCLAAKWVAARCAGDHEDLGLEINNLRELSDHPHIVRLWAAF